MIVNSPLFILIGNPKKNQRFPKMMIGICGRGIGQYQGNNTTNNQYNTPDCFQVNKFFDSFRQVFFKVNVFSVLEILMQAFLGYRVYNKKYLT